MKRRNPRFGCPRIGQRINLAFDLDLDKDTVRRVLATHYRIKPVFSSRAGEHLSTDVLHQPDDGISFGKTRDQRGSKQNDSFCTA